MQKCSGIRRGLAGALVLLAAGVAEAQTFPSKPVTLIVPFAPGGPLDVMARAVGREVEKVWKQPLVIESRPGAGGMIGSDYVTRQPADGYTLLMHGPAPLQIRIFSKQPTFNPADLRALIALGESSYMASAHPSLGVKSLKEMVAVAKTRPGQLNYATIPLSTYELGYHLFLRQAGITMTAVPYQSAAPIIPAYLRGDIQVYFGTLTTLGPHLDSGKIVPLAWLGRQRHSRYPNVPTAAEEGYATWTYANGFLIHAKTPDDVARKLGQDFANALKEPEVIAQLDKAGYTVPPAPLDWAKQIEGETARFVEIARELKYEPQ